MFWWFLAPGMTSMSVSATCDCKRWQPHWKSEELTCFHSSFAFCMFAFITKNNAYFLKGNQIAVQPELSAPDLLILRKESTSLQHCQELFNWEVSTSERTSWQKSLPTDWPMTIPLHLCSIELFHLYDIAGKLVGSHY
jgi:hypothetical protein